MTTQDSSVLHYFIISDSIGETAVKVADSALAQFPDVETVLHKYVFISNISDLMDALQHANEVDGLVFMTIVDNNMAREAEKFCINTGLICYNLIQPFMLEIQRRTGQRPSGKSGVQHELTDTYFKRVEAMEFCMRYDDGKDPQGLREAEIILLGISRTGKTPLSMYLATRGFKVTNLPLIPENDIPDQLFEVDPRKIVGLTNDLRILSKHRKNRMIEYGINEETSYSSHQRIEQELTYSNEIYMKLGCPVINVADRSIEESATIILDVLKLTAKR